LNFGHTVAHAIEKKEGLSHGDAVAIGMVQASKLSLEHKLINASQLDRIVALIKKFNLPTELTVQVDDFFDILIKDKKAISDSVDYILLQNIGQSEIRRIPFTELKDSLRKING